MFSNDLLKGRAALVTGASSGLGRHFAALLAAHGANVVVAARRAGELAKVVDEIVEKGGRASAVTLDVRDPASVQSAIAGAGAIDILINNAGTANTKPVLEIGEDDWQLIIDTNLSGVFRVAQAAARAMQTQKRGGAIVNIASILAYRVAKQVPAYVAAKAAVVRLTEALALELAPLSIRVNALAPGYIETDINREFLRSTAGDSIVKRVPMRRFGLPTDLDGALLLLASDAGGYLTGSTIVVDGGHGLSWL